MDEIHSSLSGHTRTPINSQTNYPLLPAPDPNPKAILALRIMLITFGSLLGTLLRIILQQIDLSNYERVNDSDFISNILGLLMIGINKGSGEKSTNFDALLETGFCGSLTSWSSWIISLIIVSQNFNQAESIFVFFITLSLFNSAYQTGCQIGTYLGNKTIRISLSKTVSFLLLLSIVSLIYILITIAYFAFPNNQKAFLWEGSLAIASIGSLLRFYLSTKLNSKSWLPLGTFVSNLVAILLGSLIVRFDTNQTVTLKIMRCGFVGTLGTLSTWVKQEHGFKKVSQKWLYGFAMVGFSVLISFSILNKY